MSLVSVIIIIIFNLRNPRLRNAVVTCKQFKFLIFTNLTEFFNENFVFFIQCKGYMIISIHLNCWTDHYFLFFMYFWYNHPNYNNNLNVSSSRFFTLYALTMNQLFLINIIIMIMIIINCLNKIRTQQIGILYFTSYLTRQIYPILRNST